MNNIPVFPVFKKLELSDREWIENITSKFPPYSDFNFVSLWSYNVKEEAEVSTMYGNLVVMFHDYITGEPFYTFIGSCEQEKTAHNLLMRSKIEGIRPRLKLIPEVVRSTLDLKASNLHFHDDEDNFDYIFDLNKLVQLQGQEYKDLRWVRNKYLKNNLYTVNVSQHFDDSIKSMILQLFDVWVKNKQIVEEKYFTELEALKRLLKLNHFVNLDCITIRYKNEPIAFSINQVIDNNYAIGHFAKADVHHNKIWDYLFYNTCLYYRKLGINTMNLQQDLGSVGLRNSKRSWKPNMYLKKYLITNSIT